MEFPENQLRDPPKTIGKLKGVPVIHMRTKGGYHIVRVKGQRIPSGVGPNKRIALFIAQKNEPEMVFTELSKSEHGDVATFEHLLPRYEAVTALLRKP